MLVRILVSAKYSHFEDGRAKAQWHEAGAEVDFPDWYARDIVKSNLAEFVGTPPEPEEPAPQVDAKRKGFSLADDAALEQAGLIKPKTKRKR